MARDLTLPPPDVRPERLFALLVRPSPELAIRFRFHDAADVTLLVRPIPSDVLGELDTSATELPPEAARQRRHRELVARALWTRHEPAFASADDVDLDTAELAAITREVREALSVVGPTYARSDWPAWQAVLERGARHPLNMSTAIALASCADYGHGGVTFRPDRFWGRPTIELLDGHWFCFRAARAAWVKDAPSTGARTVGEALQQARAKQGNQG